MDEHQTIFYYAATLLTGFILGYLASSKSFINSYGDKRTSQRAGGGEHVDTDDKNEFVFSDSIGETKMVLVVRNDLKMGKGKAAAQCSHAAVMAHERAAKTHPGILREWKMNGQRKIVVKTESENELLDLAQAARKNGLVYAVVQDAGLTQVKNGTRTVLAVGPGPQGLVDMITGHLKLY